MEVTFPIYVLERMTFPSGSSPARRSFPGAKEMTSWRASMRGGIQRVVTSRFAGTIVATCPRR